jgi:hypothetical protein
MLTYFLRAARIEESAIAHSGPSMLAYLLKTARIEESAVANLGNMLTYGLKAARIDA